MNEWIKFFVFLFFFWFLKKEIEYEDIFNFIMHIYIAILYQANFSLIIHIFIFLMNR